MSRTARALLPLAVFFFALGCRTGPTVPPSPPGSTRGLDPSANLIVGRVLAVAPVLALVIVDLNARAPAPPVGAELLARTDTLQPTARLRASANRRGRTLGTTLVDGLPAVGDEVVFPAR